RTAAAPSTAASPAAAPSPAAAGQAPRLEAVDRQDRPVADGRPAVATRSPRGGDRPPPPEEEEPRQPQLQAREGQAKAAVRPPARAEARLVSHDDQVRERDRPRGRAQQGDPPPAVDRQGRRT